MAARKRAKTNKDVNDFIVNFPLHTIIDDSGLSLQISNHFFAEEPYNDYESDYSEADQNIFLSTAYVVKTYINFIAEVKTQVNYGRYADHGCCSV